MVQFFILAGFRYIKGAPMELEIIRTMDYDADSAESKIRDAYPECTMALAFDTLEDAKNWKM